MDELMMYEYLNRRGMGGMSESEFRNKFRDFMMCMWQSTHSIMIMLSCLRVGLVTM